MRLWAVYDLDGDAEPFGPVAWPIDQSATGEWAVVETPDMPPICPLPRSVHRTRAAANRAVSILVYGCRGSA